MNNRLNGMSFEHAFAKKLHDNGFWVHLLTQNVAGQPADVIAVRDGHVWLFDCKDCRNDSFSLSRIESNQELAMRMFADAAETTPMFALKMSDAVYMLPYRAALTQRNVHERKSLSKYWCQTHLITLKEWLSAI